MENDTWHIGGRVEECILPIDRQRDQEDASEGIFRSPALPLMGGLPRLAKVQLPRGHNEAKD